MGNTTYAEKLKNPKWQRKRLHVMERDNWKCVKCGNDKAMLAVHHKEYRPGAEPWEYADSELETVCDPCHKKEHKIETPIPPVFVHDPSGILKQLLALPEHSETDLIRMEMLKIEVDITDTDQRDEEKQKSLSEKWMQLYNEKAKLHEENRRKIRLGL